MELIIIFIIFITTIIVYSISMEMLYKNRRKKLIKGKKYIENQIKLTNKIQEINDNYKIM